MRAHEYAVGAGIMIGSRLLTGAGYTLKVPAIDLAEVGAGGGSHVWIDAGGALQVGPRERRRRARARSATTPAATVPTITDANVHARLPQPRRISSAARSKLNADEGARGVRGQDRRAARHDASSARPTART